MTGESEEPKHPYVTDSNGKVHLIFSVIILFFSVVQIILGIVISEKLIPEIQFEAASHSSYNNMDEFHSFFYGDSVWIGFVGFILAGMGFSVYRTKSRSNGIMTSTMLFICGFGIYPTSATLTGVNMYYIYNYPRIRQLHEITRIRAASAILQGVTGVVCIVYAFYSALHSCCNSKVRKQRRLNIPAGTIQVQQPQVQQPQFMQPQMVIMSDGRQGYIVPAQTNYGQQPMYMGQPQYAQLPQYVQQTPPSNIAVAQVPAQVHHGQQVSLPGAALPGAAVSSATPVKPGSAGSNPPAYTD